MAGNSEINTKARIFIGATATIGTVAMVAAFQNFQLQHPFLFFIVLIIALLTSGMKVVVPGINGTMSVTFLFVLLGCLEFSLAETMFLGCAATLTQCFWKMNRPAKPVRVLFNVVSMMAPAVYATHTAFHAAGRLSQGSLALMMLAATCAFFLANTLPIALVISLVEERHFSTTWKQYYFWTFPLYLAGAGLVAFVHMVKGIAGWKATLLVLPVVYWVYRSYRLYVGKLENEKRHVEEMAAIHLRTVEALALAIDAKDHTTHDHLRRVRVYALGVARELQLPEPEVEALKAASMLHDIGKLAVPEHIISKPGRLTPEEFEKMQIHPIIGAEILDRVKFPYPVVPIVRSHHEKWDGTGHPDGLKGEEIPLGSRILAAVDCLDALASDRQYRRALPLDEAMEYVANLAGKDFDPTVVKILQKRYLDLEQEARSEKPAEETASHGPLQLRSATPGSGFERETSDEAAQGKEIDFLNTIASARQEAQILFELTHELGNSLSLDETLSLASARLRKLVPFDAIAVWIRENDVLIPRHVNGDNFRLLSSLEIPMGQGLSGWVTQNNQTILNGNPAVESSYLEDSSRASTLKSALSVPLEGVAGTIGSLTLYRSESDGFSRDNLRILLAISSKVALSIENAMKYQEAQGSIATDPLTGLPNAHSLFLHLDREIIRCERTNAGLAVIACDLNGFKTINERFGHSEGDGFLRTFSARMKESCREYDYVARMGGDEFVIVIPGLTQNGAFDKAVRLNECVLHASRHLSGAASLSLAIGTAFYREDGMEAEQLLANADRRMYLDKALRHRREGRLSGLALANPASMH
ncbi:MAG TPA: HD domain-containing phosphohydrolase [Terriglobales bacterium]|nr:HD domain-containing phosphohydrolase [Terriglobales bacterium]